MCKFVIHGDKIEEINKELGRLTLKDNQLDTLIKNLDYRWDEECKKQAEWTEHINKITRAEGMEFGKNLGILKAEMDLKNKQYEIYSDRMNINFKETIADFSMKHKSEM